MYTKKLVILLSALFFCATSFALPNEEGGTPIPILRDNSLEHAIPPKSPAQIPVDCIYYSSLSSIVATFHYDLGSVSVIIENQTTGEYNQTTVNALAGQMIFPISASTGHWSISFSLPGGVLYYGEFELY